MKHTIDRRALLLSTAAATGALAAPRWAAAQTPGSVAPIAPIRPVTETLWGRTITDPYRWMEAGGPEWKAYALAQGAHAKQVLDAIPGRDALYAAIDGYSHDLVAVSSVQLGGDHIFVEKRPAGANTFKLYVRHGAGGADRLLIDPDTYATAGSHAALDWWTPSPDGAHVVFGVSPGGSENSTARIIVVADGVVLPETIDRTENATPNWATDGSGFFYNRLKAGVALDSIAKYMDSAAWFHRLRTDPASDTKVFWKGGSPAVAMTDVDFPIVLTTPGSTYAIGAVVSGVQNEVAIYLTSAEAAMAGRPDWRAVCTPADKVTSGAGFGDDLYLLSHKDAPRFKVLKTSAAAPSVANATVVIPESASVIRDIAAAKDGLYIHQLDAGLGGIRKLDWSGRITTIALPYPGTVSELYADTLHDGAWFLLAGWVRPPVLCRVGPDGVVTRTDIVPAPPIDVSPYVSVETFATAADGVQVPLSILYRKGLKRDGSAPLILNAYGAYGITQEPSFAARWLAFLDLGGVYAVAHVRGGGELGEDWHLAGYKATKFNTWRDMIASAEYLIAEHYTSKSKLGIVGGSAGGITVGRFMTERPDLAAVVFDMVGASNASRMEFSPNGPANIPEFGSVLSEDGFKALYAMDAYQHVTDGVAYPSVLLTTGLNDPRVSSWEPTKMTARLQAATSSKNPVILRVETDAGHGIGSTLSQRNHETADMIAFLLWRTGDPRYQPGGGKG